MNENALLMRWKADFEQLCNLQLICSSFILRWQMRKEIVEHRTTAGKGQGTPEWLDLDSIAHVQLTSEDPAFPIENAPPTLIVLWACA